VGGWPKRHNHGGLSCFGECYQQGRNDTSYTAEGEATGVHPRGCPDCGFKPIEKE